MAVPKAAVAEDGQTMVTHSMIAKFLMWNTLV